MALTSGELSCLVEELLPHIDTREHMTESGRAAYGLLFSTYPEFIQLFPRMQGLTVDNVMQSEGIKYHGRVLVDSLKTVLLTATNEVELRRQIDELIDMHHSRISREQCLAGESVFIRFFNEVLKKEQNQLSMEKFLRYVFPAMAKGL
ncbi:unnamed protein product [Calicophoron daubneyi]|uniref:Globin domain-containing protein n=1 Tax=Calicophoron daubneyi TaxID=300641 RepID=A0AAV2TIP7_CALDB